MGASQTRVRPDGMTYQVKLSSARRQLKKLDPDIKNDVAEAIEALKFDPRPYGVLKL